MSSPSRLLLDGALLGDVVESLTGQDIIVERSKSKCEAVTGGLITHCSHTVRAFAGSTLVGTAKVIWKGESDGYSDLLRGRMRNYLREHGVRPINESFDTKNEVLSRRFKLKSQKGMLCIHEKLFLKQIQLLPSGAKGANGENLESLAQNAFRASRLSGQD